MNVEFQDLLKIMLGSGLTSALTTWGLNHHFVYKASINRDARYLAHRIAIILEQYAIDCAKVISENDLHRTSGGSLGSEHLGIPKLLAYPNDADWKALDPLLSDRVMSFPRDLSLVEGQLSFWWEIGDDDDVSVETDSQAATCGLQAWETAIELRKRYKIPEIDISRITWDFELTLRKEVIAKIERKKKAII